jgi:hypothetical protein
MSNTTYKYDKKLLIKDFLSEKYTIPNLATKHNMTKKYITMILKSIFRKELVK